MSNAPMSKGEREDLQRLVRQREKVLKSAAKQRSTEMLAEFENHLAARYQFDQDETWAEAERLARAEVERSNARIAARCAELGIPKDFAPSLDFHWYGRGENASKVRRQELRKVAVKVLENHPAIRWDAAVAKIANGVAGDGLDIPASLDRRQQAAAPVSDYAKALKFIADFKGEPGDLLNWWRKLAGARAKMSFEEAGHLGKVYTAKFNELSK